MVWCDLLMPHSAFDCTYNYFSRSKTNNEKNDKFLKKKAILKKMKHKRLKKQKKYK